MAREYGRLMCSVWKDKGYKALSLADQGLFAGILAYPQISWCGVIDFIPERMVQLSDELNMDGLYAGLNRLLNAGFLVIDNETRELLVRKFIRYDGVIKMKNVGKAMATALERVISTNLRDIVVVELAALYVEFPSLHGWDGISEVDPDLFDEIVSEATC